jgi:integrase/recombinase XerD
VNHIIKKVAAKFNVTPKVSAHWFRHAHASHSLDRGAPLSVVAATLGHDNISTTSAYLHAKPGTTSGDALDAEIWKVNPEP